MDQIIRINDINVAIRKINENTFEPKNTKILKQAFENKFRIPETNFFEENETPKETSLKTFEIQSFCFVATKEVKEEASILLLSLREFHKQPVYILCDKVTKTFLSRDFENVYFRVQAEREQLDQIQNRHFKTKHQSLNKFHKTDCIFKKMDCMNFALENHENTFFLDSDIVVLSSLQENFTDKLVLSPHFYSEEEKHKGFEFGFYNAGYVFCAEKGFPNFWKHMYLNDSLFFEQECMNRFPDHYRIQTFPENHNVGFWRKKLDPEKKIKSLHVHLSEEIRKRVDGELRKQFDKIKDFSFEYLKRNNKKIYNYAKKITNISKKVAFIHFGKCAGVYTQAYLRKHVLSNYEIFNSWWDFNGKRERSLSRDWTKEELMLIASKETDKAFTHNHHINWDLELIKNFKKNRWLTFTFLRDPREIICSLYFWANNQKSRKELSDEAKNPLKGEIMRMSGQTDPSKVSLDLFFDSVTTQENARKLWTLPSYIEELDWVTEFNEKNFELFLDKYFCHTYLPEKRRNVSQNAGYEYYARHEIISKETQRKIETDPEFLKYSKYIEI